MTGEVILKTYEKAFENAPDNDHINDILNANTDLAQRLTKRQKTKLAKMVLTFQK